MWTRAELKDRAKASLRGYYWYAFLACIIAGILGGGSSRGSGGISIGRRTQQRSHDYSSSGMSISEILSVFMITAAIILIVTAVLITVSIFVGSAVQVGLKRFLLESRYFGRSAGLDKLFFVFGSGHYLNVVKIMFLRGLYTFLWSLLLIIPGIIKAYEYSMIPYILADNPGIEASEAFRLTKVMTTDEKLNIFVLELSFIGWHLLGLLLCCIGGIFVTPYVEATMTELYVVFRQRCVENRDTYRDGPEFRTQ